MRDLEVDLELLSETAGSIGREVLGLSPRLRATFAVADEQVAAARAGVWRHWRRPRARG
jgi:hypothetical protein